MPGTHLTANPVHLGLGATAEIEPRFTGELDWYSDYSARHAADGPEGRLVSMHTFNESWNMWEMHPQGSEVVLCLSGSINLLQEHEDGALARVSLGPGEYLINDAGTWHTADVREETTVLFITAGVGTQHRPR